MIRIKIHNTFSFFSVEIIYFLSWKKNSFHMVFITSKQKNVITLILWNRKFNLEFQKNWIPQVHFMLSLKYNVMEFLLNFHFHFAFLLELMVLFIGFFLLRGFFFFIYFRFFRDEIWCLWIRHLFGCFLWELLIFNQIYN
jgi:hypothetical protein